MPKDIKFMNLYDSNQESSYFLNESGPSSKKFPVWNLRKEKCKFHCSSRLVI